MRTPPAGARPLTARSAPAGPVAPSRAAAGRRGRSDGTVYWLALFLAALTLFSAAPALPHWNLIQAPNWARAMLILTALELVYIAWMVTLPDWITVWIGMIVFALVAALYGMALAMALVTPSGRPLMLDLTDVRRGAVGWSAAALLLSAFMVYACGRVAGKWRRAAAT